MRILLTRPLDQSVILADALRKLGHEVFIFPLLDIVPLGNKFIEPDDAQALVATSAHAFQMTQARLSPALLRRDVFVVGEVTAQAARQAGFARVHVGQTGDAGGLVALIENTLKPQSGPLLYLCGVHHGAGIENGLARLGFRIISEPVYEAVAIRPAAGVMSAMLLENEIDAVLLFSPRTAGLFRDALTQTPGESLCAYCLSPSVAQALEPLNIAVKTASLPNEASLLSLLPGSGYSQG